MTQERINSKTMKAINRRNVLNMIRKEGAISRCELSGKTGLTTGTITNLISELIGLGYLKETGSGQSQGGRRPILLELNAEAGYAVGLELEATHITGVVSDFKAQILCGERIRMDVADGKDAVIGQMVDLVEALLKTAGIQRENIFGLGLAIPGPCNYAKGIMINPPNFPGWIDVPIKAILERRLGLKVYTSKETSCAALSEYWFGKAAGAPRIFGITVGEVGIGGALVLDGAIFQEKEGESMDIGHMTVQMDGQPCSCGNRGCLEAHADGHAMMRYVKEQLGREKISPRPEWLTYEGILAGVAANDPLCVEAVKTCAFYISVALGNVLGLLSPQHICLGGDFIDRCPLLYDKIVEYLERRTYPASAREAVKSPFTFGKNSGAVGGLALVFDALSKA